MKILLLFNEAYDGNRKFDLCDSASLFHMIQSMTMVKEILVCTGPSQYTACRRNMSLALGWSYDRPIKTYGFNLLRHFIKDSKCFIVKNKLIWTKCDEQYDVVNIKTNPEYLREYTGNINLFENAVIDCSIENIWKHMNTLRHDLKQEYYDKFA